MVLNDRFYCTCACIHPSIRPSIETTSRSSGLHRQSKAPIVVARMVGVEAVGMITSAMSMLTDQSRFDCLAFLARYAKCTADSFPIANTEPQLGIAHICLSTCCRIAGFLPQSTRPTCNIIKPHTLTHNCDILSLNGIIYFKRGSFEY